MFKNDEKSTEEEPVIYIWNEKGDWEETEDNKIRKNNDKI